MKFNDFATIHEELNQDALRGLLQQTLRPELVSQVMQVLFMHQHSPLCKFIMGRITNPEHNVPQKFEIRKLETLEAYKLDPVVFNLLLNIKEGDVGPGEVLIALIGGTWKGGNHEDYDVNLPNIGKVEVKYLGPFAHSTNVPMGSSHSKRIVNTDFAKIIEEIGSLIKLTPEIIKGLLTSEEMNYFLLNTVDQIFVWNENLSTNSLRLIGRMLRNAEKVGNKSFSNKGITFARLVKAMESALHNAIGSAQFLMFLGNKTVRANDPLLPSTVYDGQYYIMPKQDVKYYMFYRLYKNERIKIAPFSTEREFFEKTVN